MILYSLKEGLKRARKEAGFTQQKLFKELEDKKIIGHIKTVQNWEQGISEPSLGTLIKLTHFYDCDLDYLTGRIDCKTHDLQFIHDQTGLTEEAIIKIKELSAEQLTALNQLIEHQDFKKAISQTAALSDKESINNDYAALILHHYKSRFGSQKTTQLNGNMVEKSMLFTLSNLMTRILCDITETEL